MLALIVTMGTIVSLPLEPFCVCSEELVGQFVIDFSAAYLITLATALASNLILPQLKIKLDERITFVVMCAIIGVSSGLASGHATVMTSLITICVAVLLPLAYAIPVVRKKQQEWIVTLVYDGISVVCGITTMVTGGTETKESFRYGGTALVASLANVIMLLVQKYCTTKVVAQRIINLAGLIACLMTSFAWGLM